MTGHTDGTATSPTGPARVGRGRVSRPTRRVRGASVRRTLRAGAGTPLATRAAAVTAARPVIGARPGRVPGTGPHGRRSRLRSPGSAAGVVPAAVPAVAGTGRAAGAGGCARGAS